MLIMSQLITLIVIFQLGMNVVVIVCHHHHIRGNLKISWQWEPQKKALGWQISKCPKIRLKEWGWTIIYSELTIKKLINRKISVFSLQKRYITSHNKNFGKPLHEYFLFIIFLRHLIGKFVCSFGTMLNFFRFFRKKFNYSENSRFFASKTIYHIT